MIKSWKRQALKATLSFVFLFSFSKMQLLKFIFYHCIFHDSSAVIFQEKNAATCWLKSLVLTSYAELGTGRLPLAGETCAAKMMQITDIQSKALFVSVTFLWPRPVRLLVSRSVCRWSFVSYFSKRAESYTFMLLSEHLFFVLILYDLGTKAEISSLIVLIDMFSKSRFYDESILLLPSYLCPFLDLNLFLFLLQVWWCRVVVEIWSRARPVSRHFFKFSSRCS